MPTTYVLGVGPGLGAALCRRFAREGHALALMARKKESLEPLRAEVEKAGGRAIAVEVDAASTTSVEAGFALARGEIGPADVFIYNAATFAMGGVLELDPIAFEQGFRINCTGALLGAQQVLPAMLQNKRGTILLTGATASIRGGARFAGFATGKFALRALAQSMARELHPQGVHVAHVIVDGQIDTERVRARGGADRDPKTMLSPDGIAETYWQLHAQDPTSWTHEIDVRPSVEKF